MQNVRKRLPKLAGRLARTALRSVTFTFALAHSGSAAAEVVDVAQNGFSLSETAHIAAAPDKVYAALVVPSRWWSSKHTFSGNAANLTFDARAGGCWCETLPNGGSVEHLVVVYAVPGKALRLRGALGPFQGLGVDGALTWSLKGDASGTDLTATYNLGGYIEDGFGDLSKAADGVLAEQTTRLKAYVETGSPEIPKTN